MNNITPLNNDIFAAHADSAILSPVVSRELAGIDQRTGKTDLPVSGFVGNYTVRDGNPVFLGVVSDSYEIVQMRDLVARAENAMRSFFTAEQLRNTQIKDVSGRGGAFVERRWTVPAFAEALTYGNATAKTLEVGTTVAAELRVRTGYDGGTRTTLMNGALDLVCNKGMVAMTDLDVFSRKHTSGSDVNIFTPWLEQAVESFHERVREIRQWAETPVTWSQVEDTVRALPGISERRAEQMLARVRREVHDRGLNAYAVLSGFTFYSSHNSTQFPVRQTGNDNVATTLADREAEVQRWVRSEPFQALLAA